MYSRWMILNPKYDYEDLDRVTLPNGKRYYVCPKTGKKLVSVTTLIDSTSDKSFLVEWENRIGSVEAAKQKKYGSDVGSLVHTHLECHCLDVERPSAKTPIRKEAKRMADAMIEKCMDGIDEIWGMETILYYPELYAGTTDVVGVYKGKPAIMDYKTAKNMRTHEQIEGYRDQICAYIIAHDIMFGTSIEHGVIFMVDRKLNTEVFEMDRDEVLKHKNSFLERVEKYLENPIIFSA